MLLRCSACDVSCTVDDESAESVSCPSCGRLLHSGSISPADEVTGVEVAIGVDSVTAIGQAVPVDTTRNWNRRDAQTLLDATTLPCRMGRYEIQKLLASGGFAQVYLARDLEIDRQVALKLTRGDRIASSEQMAAMLAEARLAARVRHANIATVYDVGYLDAGIPFISMEYLTGGTLRELLESTDLAVMPTLELLAKVADALQHAHENGLVHRDLKPGNIMIDEFGQPKIVDFGLAVDEDRQGTLGGDVSGTPSYMAPEQIRGEAHHLDGRTDIWALGVILYEILCGRRPFNGSRDRVFDEVLNRDPKPPRQVDNTIPQDLEAVCLRCLAKSTSARFGNCGDVANAIRDWLANASTDIAPDVTPRSHSTGARRFNALLAAGNTSSSRRVVPFVQPPRRSRPIWPWLTMVALLSPALVYWTPVWGLLSVSAPAPRDWKLGRLYEVLDQKPQEILWTAIAKDSQWTWNPQSHQVLVTSAYPAALQTGETKSANFRLELRFSVGSATGDSGLFWGAHPARAEDGTAGRDFQVLSFRRLQNEVAPNGFRLARDNNTTWTPPGGPAPLMSREHLIMASIDPPIEPQQILQIEVLLGRLTEVRWNGKIIPSLPDSPEFHPSRPLESTGGFGLYNEGGTTIFHEMRIELTEPPQNTTP